MTGVPAERFRDWCAQLEARHLQSLTFPEVRRGLQALSSLYVQRRDRLQSGAALDGAGKRAAFALFYGPVHFLVVREIVRSLDAAKPAPRRIVDLGCGTGAAGAAWALEARGGAPVSGIDLHPWALSEARWTYRALGLSGKAVRGDAAHPELPGPGGAVLAAYTVNELDHRSRDLLLESLLSAATRGCRVLIVEPIARRALRWWDSWSAAFREHGGRSDTWRFPSDLPGPVRRLDRAAGLDHAVLTARSLYLPGAAD